MQAYTDYPIIELGDEPYKLAPIRKCKIISYDGSLYCMVEVEGVTVEIKSGYLYTMHGRCGSVPVVFRATLNELRK